MIVLNSEEIKDFQSCELLYRYRNIDKVIEPIYSRQMAIQRFQVEMKKMFTFFFYKKQGGSIPSYAALVNRWQRNWFGDTVTASDVTSGTTEPNRTSDSALATRAATILMNFHNDFGSSLAQPLILSEVLDYSYSDKIKLSSDIDLALRVPGSNKVLIIKWTFTETVKGAKDYGSEFAMADYILRNKSTLAKDHTFVYATYEVKTSANQLKPFDLEQKHHNSLQFWVNKIGQTEIFAPRRGLSTACKKCNFDEACAKFNEYFEGEYEGHIR
jgi:hypothetical protein